jgi:tRNA-dihydrouridine synthase B
MIGDGKKAVCPEEHSENASRRVCDKKFWTEKIKIGNQEYPRFMSAPLDGITDSPMRQLIREYSKDVLLFTEMRHVACVANEKTEKSVKYNSIEQPLCFQVSANSTQFLEKAVAKIVSNKFVMFNLNAGCPAKCVIKSGSGSALMANTSLLKNLLVEFKNALPQTMPLTLKIRAGFKEKNAYDVSLMAEQCGVDMIVVHPRTQPGGFSEPLDFDLVAKIKKSVSIPVVFSGNIHSFSRAEMTHEKTGVDGFMIGRALWGAPWKIREIMDKSLNKDFKISQKDILKCALRHMELNVVYYGEHGINPFKKQIPQYIKAIPNAAEIRCQLVRSQSAEEMRNQLENLIRQAG